MKPLWVCTGLVALCLAPPLWADEAKKAEKKSYEVPYRLTSTKHVLVRAKINGKGPYNFLIDTGAPALFVATAVSKKLGVEPDKKGWGTFDRFELEGGLVAEKAAGRIEDPFQLKGMNGLGLAGAELHGVIGYNLLARYKIEFDFTRDKMSWTPLDFDPPAPEGLGGKNGQAGIDAMAKLIEMAVMLLGNRPKPEVLPRGFLGVELAEDKDGVLVKAVLDKSAAAAAGVRAGDRITRYEGEEVKALADLHKKAAKLAPGESAKLTVRRGGQEQEITVKTGEGL